MMVSTITAVGIFQNSVALGLSYGVCVSILMLGTDLLIALGMVVVWEAHPFWPLAYLCCFGFIDGVFFTANLTKIPKGQRPPPPSPSRYTRCNVLCSKWAPAFVCSHEFVSSHR